MQESGPIKDAVIDQAITHWIHRFTVNGVNVSDFLDVTAAINRWDEWCAAWSARAKVHEDRGRAAMSTGAYLSAVEHLMRASVTYHFAKYLFVQDMTQLRAAHARAVDCLNLILPYLSPPGERVVIPFEGKHLIGVLRKPHNVARPPIMIMAGGLDAAKEELFTFQPDFLSRGIAILAVDLPGQGEGEYDFAIRPDFETVAAPIIDWLATRSDVDSDRLGIWGISLGAYYAPRAAAFDRRIKACVANCGPYDFGALWKQLPALSRAAFIQRSGAANDAEGQRKAAEISLKGIGEKIKCPTFIIAAGLDTLCPPEDGKRLASEVKGPVEILVIEDATHVAHNRPYAYRPQSADWMARQLEAVG